MSDAIRVRGVELFRSSARARLPFGFGAVTVRELTLLDVRVRIEVGGRRVEGWAADCAVPRWFRKDVARSVDDDVAELITSVWSARECFLRHGAEEHTLFALWWRVYRERVDALPPDHAGRLVQGFGVALIERALIDAVCRAAEVGFHAALRDGRFGFEPAIVRDDLRGFDLARSLPERP